MVSKNSLTVKLGHRYGLSTHPSLYMLRKTSVDIQLQTMIMISTKLVTCDEQNWSYKWKGAKLEFEHD